MQVKLKFKLYIILVTAPECQFIDGYVQRKKRDDQDFSIYDDQLKTG